MCHDSTGGVSRRGDVPHLESLSMIEFRPDLVSFCECMPIESPILQIQYQWSVRILEVCSV